MIPTILGLCADQVNSFVDQFCASFLRNGSVTALYNSNRVMQLPLALFGVAVASVSLPALSRSASLENKKEFKELLSFSLRIANFVLIPSALGLVVLGLPIVQALFQHGRFTAEFSNMTFYALVPYSVGLPTYSAIKILATAFYAMKNTKTPVRVALWAMLVNAICDFALMWNFGVGGLAMATTISAWVQCVALFYYLRKEIGPFGGREILRSFVFGSIAGLIMVLVCGLLNFYVLAGVPVILRVLVSISAGGFLYFFAAKKMKIPEYDFFMGILTKRKIPV
jgi:putative peptidoglycan lipid II flippase